MPKTLPSQTDGTEGMVVVKLRSPALTVKAELGSPATRKALLGEFFGTLLFVIFGAGTVVVTGGLLGERLTSARLLAWPSPRGSRFRFSSSQPYACRAD